MHMHQYMNCCGGEPQEALSQSITLKSSSIVQISIAVLLLKVT